MKIDEVDKLRKEYKLAELDYKHLKKEPLQLFSKWFEEAVKAEEMEPNAMALATIGQDNAPNVRMVLLKGVEHDKFVFYTNYNSQKGKDLINTPQVSLLFWWQTIERQVRIKGVASKVSTVDSDTYFSSRPIGSQLGAIVSPQSKVIESRETLEKNYNALIKTYDVNQTIERPNHWGGFAIDPYEFEFWQGRENRMHDRFRYRKAENMDWTIERLAP